MSHVNSDKHIQREVPVSTGVSNPRAAGTQRGQGRGGGEGEREQGVGGPYGEAAVRPRLEAVVFALKVEKRRVTWAFTHT